MIIAQHEKAIVEGAIVNVTHSSAYESALVGSVLSHSFSDPSMEHEIDMRHARTTTGVQD